MRLGGVGRLANLAKLYGGSNSAPDAESWQERSLERSRWGMFGGQGHHAEVTATKKMMTPRQLAQAETGRMHGKCRRNEHPPH